MQPPTNGNLEQIAELLDNAVDEIQNGATYVKVDQIFNAQDFSHALLFQDDGGGMDPECIQQFMSLGYSMKNTNKTIGQYGNGFKTSTMRLGADAIVFTRSACGRYWLFYTQFNIVCYNQNGNEDKKLINGQTERLFC